jgi:hypothetical protein
MALCGNSLRTFFGRTLATHAALPVSGWLRKADGIRLGVLCVAPSLQVLAVQQGD